MGFCSCRKESIHRTDRTPCCFTAGHRPAPSLGHVGVDGQSSALKSQWQFMLQPLLKPASTLSPRHAFHAVMKLCQRDDTDENPILICCFHPTDETGIGPRLDPFRDCICVQKKAHRLVFRGRSLSRRTLKPDSRRGDSAKNSARLPTRFVFRCHSSAPTTTAAVRPFRVMVCCPSDIAFSIISLNFALASATVQLCEPITNPPSLIEVIIVILVIREPGSGGDA